MQDKIFVDQDAFGLIRGWLPDDDYPIKAIEYIRKDTLLERLQMYFP